MRGVCALNLEAMTMFQDEGKGGTAPAGSVRSTAMKCSRSGECDEIMFTSCCMLDCCSDEMSFSSVVFC